MKPLKTAMADAWGPNWTMASAGESLKGKASLEYCKIEYRTAEVVTSEFSKGGIGGESPESANPRYSTDLHFEELNDYLLITFLSRMITGLQ